ncbi:MAG: TIGR03013 family PEP-CTERM/XrtA system glycosyltransferase [Desulfobulbaceae bacterium]|nr:TIGR03013 family PEP-CTERM/XrtA system glycosyltransferase [Desulfobulbaceae bacterium]
MPFLFKKYYPSRNVFFFLGEGLLIFLVISGVYFFFKGSQLFCDAVLLYGLRALFVTLIFQLCLYFFDLYDLSGVSSQAEVYARIVQAFGVGCVMLGVVYFFVPFILISSQVFWTAYVAICVTVFAWRFLYNFVLDRRMFSQSIIVLGTGKLAAEIANEIENARDSGYKIVFFVSSKEALSPELPANVPVHSEIGDILSLSKKHRVEKIVVALDDRRGKTPIPELLQCKMQGISIENGITFYEGVTGKILVENVNPSWLIFSDGFRKNPICSLGKRFLDIVFAAVGLLVASPVMLISAIIIKLESPGTIFYSQERLGEREKVFKVIKFRSMGCDAEKDGPVWAMQNDCRVTRYGGFMRKVRIDEIPQMLNVLKGEMSFVGPRPERPVFVEELAKKIPYYSLRHSVKPGITGWAQICYPYGASEEDALRKLEYDLYYIKNLSLPIDLWIVFQTIKTVLFQKGSR